MSFLDNLKKGYMDSSNDSLKPKAVCPYCGKEQRVLGRYGDAKCSNCGKIFKYDTRKS